MDGNWNKWWVVLLFIVALPAIAVRLVIQKIKTKWMEYR